MPLSNITIICNSILVLLLPLRVPKPWQFVVENCKTKARLISAIDLHSCFVRYWCVDGGDRQKGKESPVLEVNSNNVLEKISKFRY